MPDLEKLDALNIFLEMLEARENIVSLKHCVKGQGLKDYICHM